MTEEQTPFRKFVYAHLEWGTMQHFCTGEKDGDKCPQCGRVLTLVRLVRDGDTYRGTVTVTMS